MKIRKAFSFFKHFLDKRIKENVEQSQNERFYKKIKKKLRKFNKNYIQELHFGTLVIALYSFCGNKKMKHGFLWKHLFQKKQQYGGSKIPQGNKRL